MQPRAAPQLDRLDRYVRRSYVKTNDSASRYRVSFSLEEALRLASLPSEEEGRIYCFRRITLTGIPAQASRKTWMDRVQQALSEFAAQAVRGTDPGAANADAVYFHHTEEMLETLLRLALGPGAGAGPQWFAASILGIPPQTAQPAHVQAIFDRLRQPSIPTAAAAAIILAAIGRSDPGPLLTLVPSFMVRDWLREFDRPKRLASEPPPIRLPEQFRMALHQAACQFGWRDSSTIWLTALAVIYLSPSTLASGTAVRIARSTLRELEAVSQVRTAEPPKRALPTPRGVRPLIFDDDHESTEPSDPAVPRIILEDATAAQVANVFIEAGSAPAGELVRAPNLPSTTPDPALLGEPTLTAGLYFLLTVLRRLGIAAALESCPELGEADFVAHILKRIAVQSAVAADDRALLCLNPEQSEFSLPPDILAAPPEYGRVWPANLSPTSRTGFDSRYLLRVWVLAIRRWCWRAGRLAVRDILHRKGRIWLTRTELDVTLPLHEVDIRIRRIGLDIDPGWVPWFGRFGKVVRFHYRLRDGEGSAW